MFKFEYEGDLCDSRRKFISQVLQDRGITCETITIEPVGKASDNYVAEVKRITAEDASGTFKMIAKFAPSNEFLRKNMNTFVYFHNETVMYTKVLPKLTELEKSAGVPEADRLRYAACYGTLTEEPNETILLEDLSVADFTIVDKHVSLTDDTVKIILDSFAKLHALSFVLKHREAETFNSFAKELINTWALMADVPEMDAYMSQSENNMQLMLQEQQLKDAVKGSMSRIPELAVKFHKMDHGSKSSVILQGDSWTNNIMFTFNDDKPVSCCMIDYQIAREGNPANDLLYMIFNCTDYDTRSKHYYHWIDFYHAVLDDYLSHFGLKAAAVYTRDALDADLKRYAKLGFSLALMVNSVLVMENSEASQMKEAMKEESMEVLMEQLKVSLAGPTVQRFQDKVSDLVKSCEEFGLF